MSLIANWPPPGYDPGVFFYRAMNRTVFLIDGFNVYHSVKDASVDMNGTSTKWLDFHSLFSSLTYLIGRDAVIQDIYYFSALAEHLRNSSPGVIKRHQDYIKCLDSTGVKVELARFKEKRIQCNQCSNSIIRHEEKETDVAIAAKLLELFFIDACDTVILVTGDTDLAPAVRTARRLFPTKRMLFCFPYRRKNNELAQLLPGSFRIKKERYTQHQLPNPVILPNGRKVYKPASW